LVGILLNVDLIANVATAVGIVKNANPNRVAVTATVGTQVSHIVANSELTAGKVIFIVLGVGRVRLASRLVVVTDVFKQAGCAVGSNVPWSHVLVVVAVAIVVAIVVIAVSIVRRSAASVTTIIIQIVVLVVAIVCSSSCSIVRVAVGIRVVRCVRIRRRRAAAAATTARDIVSGCITSIIRTTTATGAVIIGSIAAAVAAAFAVMHTIVADFTILLELLKVIGGHDTQILFHGQHVFGIVTVAAPLVVGTTGIAFAEAQHDKLFHCQGTLVGRVFPLRAIVAPRVNVLASNVLQGVLGQIEGASCIVIVNVIAIGFAIRSVGVVEMAVLVLDIVLRFMVRIRSTASSSSSAAQHYFASYIEQLILQRLVRLFVVSLIIDLLHGLNELGAHRVCSFGKAGTAGGCGNAQKENDSPPYCCSS
jgi:hypothetical protein